LRIGSISQGKMKCDSCGQAIRYAERYLIVKEKDGAEDEENGTARHYCVKCARDKGYAEYRNEKGEHILTFFQKAAQLLAPSTEPEEKEEREAKAESTEEKEKKDEESEEDSNE